MLPETMSEACFFEICSGRSLKSRRLAGCGTADRFRLTSETDQQIR